MQVVWASYLEGTLLASIKFKMYMTFNLVFAYLENFLYPFARTTMFVQLRLEEYKAGCNPVSSTEDLEW